jgi:hypothetical protein
MTCGLSAFKQLETDYITSFDMSDTEGIEIGTPEWCPLKNEKFLIEYEK